MNQTVADALTSIPARLPGESAQLDVQVLLAKVTGKPRAWVLAHPDAPLSVRRTAALEMMIKRLEDGEPLPYVLGEWEFFGLTFEVTPDVLIPRPETELLVERALARLQELRAKDLWIADVGTGSGCIAISVALNAPASRVIATDISSAALDVARRNAVRHAVAERLTFHCCDLLPDGPAEFHLIVANLPYIPTKKLKKLPIFGREPTLALDGGADGLAAIRNLIEQAPERLAPGGLLLMEIEASEGAAVLSLACDTFSEAEIHLHKDVSGHDRLLEVRV